MGKRGESLREHILWSAKELFLEVGFERTSMDAVAARAETSKRTLYAHFGDKEKLFLAVVEMARELFQSKLGSPRKFSAKPAEALTRFCAQYVQVVTYDGWIRMCRMSLAEIERFPEQAPLLYDLLFAQVEATLAAYLREEFGLRPKASVMEAEALLGQALFPRLQRALFGVDAPVEMLDPSKLRAGFDVKPIRRAVEELLERIG